LFEKGHGQGHVTHKFKFKLLFCKNSLGGDMHSQAPSSYLIDQLMIDWLID